MSRFDTVIQDLFIKGFSVIDHFLPETAHEALFFLAQTLNENRQFKRARIGRLSENQQQDEIRRDKILWLEEDYPHAAIQTYFKTIHQLKDALNQALYLSLAELESHFAFYEPGDFYKRHVDQFAKCKSRQISCVYYLNKTWKTDFGGELKLYNKNLKPIHTLLPEGNRFICFKSDLPHEVCETLQERFSITGWLKQKTLLV